MDPRNGLRLGAATLLTALLAATAVARLALAGHLDGDRPSERHDVADRDATHTQHPRPKPTATLRPTDDRDVSTVRFNLP